MFQQWRTEYVLILVAIGMVVAFSVCSMVPGLLGIFLYITATFFLLAGICAAVLGCLKFYQIYKNS